MATYYVATTGSDSNPGTIGSPFLTWQKLATVLVAGDTGYIRGGTYTAPFSPGVSDWMVTWAGMNGSSINPITISAYPGEFPVLDFTGFTQTRNTTAIRLNNCSWVHFYNLQVINLEQDPSGNIVAGWEMHDSTNITIEFCTVLNIGGAGYRNTTGCNFFTYINCDAIQCGDPISTGGGAYGNADGFDANVGVTTYIGCRSYWNSDDGFDCYANDSVVTYINCWSFWNGYVPGTFDDPGPQADGMGFKWGVVTTPSHNTIKRVYRNCIAFQNKTHGFDQNLARCAAQFYNCTSYQNGGYGWATGYGLTPREASVLRNNISYLDASGPVSDFTSLIEDHNSWDIATPSGASFESLDNTGVGGDRDPGTGALPVLDFLHLAGGSNQIDVGVDVGLPFDGAAPDLGAYESGVVPDPPATQTKIRISFTPCDPDPAGGYQVLWRVVGTSTYTDAGFFATTPAVIETGFTYPDGTYFEGVVKTPCGDTAWTTAPSDVPPDGCVKKAWGNISQSGSADPTTWTCENTIGAIVWTRASAGNYIGTLAGAFPEGKTWLMIQKDQFVGDGGNENRIFWDSVNTIQIQTRLADGTPTDGLLNNTSFEIRTCCTSVADCEPVALFESSLPDGFVDAPYSFSVFVGGTGPVTVTPTDVPAWLTIEWVAGYLVFSGTPDAELDAAFVNFTYSNCGVTWDIGTFISVNVCTDVAVDTVAFPNLLSDTTEFTYRIPLTGSPPFVLGAVTVPAFFDVTIEENDDFTWSIVLTLNRPLTGADEDTGLTLSIEVTNCVSGSDTYAASFDVIAPPSFFILQRIASVTAGVNQSIDLLALSAGVTGTIYWGDGTSDAFTSGGGGNVNLFHSYASAIGEAVQLINFSANTFGGQFSGDQFSGLPVTKWTHSAGFTAFTQTKIFSLRSYSDVTLPGATALTLFYIYGHSTSPDTTIDFTGLPSTIHALGVQQWPLLTLIDNIPAAINTELNIQSNPVLTSIDDAATGTMSFYEVAGCSSLPSSEITAHPNLGLCFFQSIFGNGYTTTDINAILVYMDSFGASGKFISLTEGGTAPPSGAGATAKANLISRGNTVTTD